MLNEPERLTEIKGITSRRAKEIARQYVEQSAMRELMDFLSEHGLPIEITALLYKRFHDSAIESLKENRTCFATRIMTSISVLRTVWRSSSACPCCPTTARTQASSIR